MLAKRIIPCLDVDAGRVVKGVRFVEIRDAGDPVEVARRYNEEGADEITFLDITASSDDRDTIVHVVEQVASEVFIPLTVGGGIRTVDDVRRMLNAGADKVAINTAAVFNPEFVRQAAIQELIGNAVLRHQAHDMGLVASQAEIRNQIASMQVFHENGEFSQKKYERLLSQFGYSPRTFPLFAERDIVVNQLRNGFLAGSFVDAQSISMVERLSNEKRTVDVLSFDASDFESSVDVSEEEIVEGVLELAYRRP